MPNDRAVIDRNQRYLGVAIGSQPIDQLSICRRREGCFDDGADGRDQPTVRDEQLSWRPVNALIELDVGRTSARATRHRQAPQRVTLALRRPPG